MKDHQIAAAPLLVSSILLFLLLFSELALGQLSSGAERVALLQLRSSLGIRSREWPRKADPCSKWNGITCSTNGRVTGVNISGFRRTRVGSRNPQFSVDSLANLTFLEFFNASNFLLPGRIPNLFGQSLVTLQVLDLSSCSIIGTIPSSIGNLTNLTSLSLGDNNLTGRIPSSLGQLSSLSVLDLSRNSLSGPIPFSFAPFTNLSTLDISSNSFSGSIIPLGIGPISALKSLNLSRNNFSWLVEPAQLGALSSLVEIDLSFNRFNGSLPEEVWSIPGLTLLDLSGNNFTGVFPDGSFSSNGPAAALNISRNSFYGNLTQLIRRFTDIDLSGNYFEGKVPDFTPSNATLSDNCLQNVLNQRTQDECRLFYAQKGLVFDNFGQPSSAPVPSPEPHKKKKTRLYILIGVLGGLGLLALLSVCCLLLIICNRRRRAPNNQGEVGVGPVPSGGSHPPGGGTNIARVGDEFTYQLLLQATNEFSDSNLIKHGHSGDLFKGFIEGGAPVVVKKVDLRTVKKEAYPVELDFFSKVSHGRFVPFLGHYLEDEDKKFLVYKYMPNEDLASSFYSKSNSDDDSLQALDWIKRLKIAVGAAEGLSYLHHECTPPLVHRDVQASSILLDDKFEVRLGSLTEVCAQEGDTHQSRITRLLRLPQSSEQVSSESATANCAYDVYCFGKVLLEIVTGKLGLSASPDAEIKEYLDQTLPYINIYDKELVTKIVDPLLIVDEDLLEEVWAMAIVARSCLNPKPSRRPPMRYILKALENPLKIVREENTDSGRLRATSSRGSWNAALFGSWRQSSDVAGVQGSLAAARAEGGGGSSLKQSGTTGSSNGNGSSSHRRHSNEIFPEPSGSQDVERFQE